MNEVKIAIQGTPDIIDIKNPKEGSLGANFPWIIKQTREYIDNYNKNSNFKIELSAVIGDFPNLPGTASLAALGAAVSGANYVKIGLMGPKNKEDAVKLAKSVVKSVKEYNKSVQIVIAGYADQYLLNTSIDPLLIPEITSESEADIAMIDTAIKNGNSLFDHLSMDKLDKFIAKSRNLNVKTALAGSLKFKDLPSIKKLEPDIIGVRTMVCENFDRLNGTINIELINKLKEDLGI